MTALVGTRHLVRLALRRDRVTLPIWIIVLGLMPSSTVSLYEQLYPTEAMRATLTTTMGSNPAITVLYGPAFDLSTPGGFTAWRMLTFLGVFIALMAIFTVTRHTRADEDAGRHELLAAGVVGRFAPLTAAVVVAGGASVLIGAVNTASITAAGAPFQGALAFGVAAASVGLVFTGVSAITAQLVEYARTSNAIASAVLGAAFLLRGIGDATREFGWLSWLSPIGWAHQVRPFAGEHWWVLGMALAAAVLTAGAGYALLARRDAGAGILPSRPGRATAVPSLRSPLALAWRLQRGSLIGWTVGFAVAGFAFGSIAESIGDLVGDNPQLREIFELIGGSTGLIDAFLAQIAGLFGMVAALYGVQATLRMRAEEIAMRAEPVLATRVTRLHWAASHLLFAMIGTAVVLAGAGITTGLAHGLRVDDLGHLGTMLGSTLAQLPAIWLVVGIAAALFGLLPRYSAVAWTIAAGALFLAMFGPVFELPQLVLDATPFAHIPKLPGNAFTATPLLWLGGLAVIALGAGLTAFRRRDIG